MKKVILIGLFLFAAGFMAFAGGSPESAGNIGPNSLKPAVWQFASGSAPSNADTYALQVFADKIAEKTKGVITVEVYSSGQLGNDREAISLMQMGSIVAATVNTSLYSAIEPAFMIMDLPYVTTSQQELVNILDKGFGEYLSNKLTEKAGLRIISWVVKGPRVVYNHRNPITGLSDMKGMKIRIMENPIMARSMELLGAIPVPLPAPERVMAMQTGVVDGCENTLSVIWQEKEYEVVKYISKTNHFNTPNTTTIANKVFESLSPELKEAVLETGKEAGAIACEYDAKINTDCEAQLIKAGLKLNVINNLQPFANAVKPVIEEYRSKIGNDAMDLFYGIKDQLK
jgi:tripartite ATP-independent transporter DctP family solute receptor